MIMSIRMKDFDALVTHTDFLEWARKFEGQFKEVVTAFNELRAEVIRRDPKTERCKQFYNPTEFSKLVGLSRSTVVRRCQEGTIQSTQPGGHGTGILIPVEEFERWKDDAKPFL